MPIKMLKISFDLPIEVLMKAVSEHNVGLNIQAYQQAAEAYTPPAEALEDKSENTLRSIILEYLKNDGRAIHTSELRDVAAKNGHSHKSLTNLLYVLYTSKLISRPAKSTYRITKRGSEY